MGWSAPIAFAWWPVSRSAGPVVLRPTPKIWASTCLLNPVPGRWAVGRCRSIPGRALALVPMALHLPFGMMPMQEVLLAQSASWCKYSYPVALAVRASRRASYNLPAFSARSASLWRASSAATSASVAGRKSFAQYSPLYTLSPS